MKKKIMFMLVGIDNTDDSFKISSGSPLQVDAAFAIDTDLNVGIGTETPNSKLDIHGGDVRIGSTYKW